MAAMSEIFKKITQHFKHDLPFVVYNKPNATKLIGIFQPDNTLFHVQDYTEKGFVFAPFEGREIVLIPEKLSQVLIADFETSSRAETTLVADTIEDEHAKSKHLELVQKGIDAIAKNRFKKVVLSRKETVSFEGFDLVSAFQKLLNTYPEAYTYCFFHPEIGLWLGGFSEQLIRIKNRNLQTMAVAGTQVYHENKAVVWQNKEKIEQRFVTDFIVESLKNDVSNLLISEPYTMKAGNLMHIKTDITANLDEPENLRKVIEILHPTPAVCGFPKDSAKAFILENEGYDRAFYSGFLGELNNDFEKGENSTDLYVNLRCMQVQADPKTKKAKVYLYVGGGITIDSIPEKEWQETVNKSKTMKKILY